ncbi:recombinase family protein [Fusobacterium gastrosuis]|uniref:recombinase family protein n=1 Tax=Fusobacterium gastrosuis TaxID=1755100 RepID=UPI002A9C2E53|nr:recombinase family protein [Fusobacterium gastrosuis]
MRYYAYHRTSTKEQHLDRGIKAIEEFTSRRDIKLEYLFTDQQTGKNFDRPQYLIMKNQMFKSIENGNKVTLIVSELDRLGRNKELTLKEIRELKDHGIRIMVLEIPTTLTELPKDNLMATMMMETINNMLIEMYASFAHAEMEKRAKRQKEGIEAKKARGEWDNYGRPRIVDSKEFAKYYKRVLQGKLKPVEVMSLMNINKSAYYRYRKEYEENSNE